MNQLTHTDSEGNANMVDVSHKTIQSRRASAYGFIELQNETVALVKTNQMKKGDVLTVAKIAGIMAAKETSRLIPLCHPLVLSKIDVDCTLLDHGVEVQSVVKCNGQTGVEMEALTAVSVALLTIYDMCKAVDKKMIIKDIHLLSKEKTDIA